MKTAYTLFLAGAPIFIVIAIVYSLLTGWHEPVGTVAVFLTGGLSLMIGVYLWRVEKSVDRGPEDDVAANIEDGDYEIGHFSPWSWWPFFLAGSATLLFLGVATQVWISFLGAGVGIVALVGWVYEYYRGDHAH